MKHRNSDWLMAGKGHFVDFHQGTEEPQRVKTGLWNYSWESSAALFGSSQKCSFHSITAQHQRDESSGSEKKDKNLCSKNVCNP